MSAAVAQKCVICHETSSKYKCPTCRSPTCSLKCSKEHAAHEHTSQSKSKDDPTKADSLASLESLPPLKIRDEVIKAPSSQRFSKVDKYVSMTEYDSSQFLQDFEYLQYVGKCVGMLGRDIVKNGWLKEMEERAANAAASHQAHQHQQHQGSHRGQSNGRGRGGMSNGPNRQNQNVPAEIKNRQNLESWIRKMKLPIMLVPNGMTWRKENQTWWKNNTKELFCTVEIKLASDPSDSSDRSILHRLSWDKSISSIVAKDLEKRLKHRRSPAAASSSGFLALLDEHCDGKGRLVSERWRDSLSVTVDIANDRLRNESSSKFLEWWQRQVKNGMVKADGLEIDEEKRHALEEMRRGAWAEIEGIDKVASDDAADSNAKVPDVQKDKDSDAIPADAGLISSSILAKLQAAHAKRLQENPVIEEIAEVSMPKSRQKKKVIVVDGQETLQDVLRYMPNGFGIVEYFHIRIWQRAALSKEIKNGTVVKVDLEGREQSIADVAAELRKRALESQGGNKTAAKKAKLEILTPSNALSNLNAYDSSSDDEDGENVSRKEEEDASSEIEDALDFAETSMPATIGSLAEIARSLGMVSSS